MVYSNFTHDSENYDFTKLYYDSMNPGAQLGEKGEAFPALFEYRQKCPNFGEKGPMHILVKFFIQNIDLKISRGKKSKIFLGGGFFLVFLEKQQ